MVLSRTVLLVACLVLWVCGCESKSVNPPVSSPVSATQSEPAVSPNAANANVAMNPQPAASPASGPGFVDACALLDKAEVGSVQGAPVQSTVPNNQMSGALAISQCYYTVIVPEGSKNLSVHLELIQTDPKSGRTDAVKDYWERVFGEKPGGKEEVEEDRESGRPLPVEGLGDEAFWTGNSKAGAVYVLKNGKMVRISLGGPDDVKTKIEKSKKLVASVLNRIS